MFFASTADFPPIKKGGLTSKPRRRNLQKLALDLLHAKFAGNRSKLKKIINTALTIILLYLNAGSQMPNCTKCSKVLYKSQVKSGLCKLCRYANLPSMEDYPEKDWTVDVQVCDHCGKGFISPRHTLCLKCQIFNEYRH